MPPGSSPSWLAPSRWRKSRTARAATFSDARCRAGVARTVRRVIPERLHQRIERGRRAARKEVDRGTIGREADRPIQVGDRPFAAWPTQRAAETRPDGSVVVRRPGVVDARVADREGAGDHRRTEPRFAHALQERLVPPEDDAVGRLRRVGERRRPRSPAPESRQQAEGAAGTNGSEELTP